MSDKLHDLINERLGTPAQAEPAGVVADRERQQALRARHERLNEWREWNQKEHGEVADGDANGATFAATRAECGLSVGDVAEITGTSPNSVTDYEAGRQSFASATYKRLQASMHAALDEVE